MGSPDPDEVWGWIQMRYGVWGESPWNSRKLITFAQIIWSTQIKESTN
jgi:hypothetical protein